MVDRSDAYPRGQKPTKPGPWTHPHAPGRARRRPTSSGLLTTLPGTSSSPPGAAGSAQPGSAAATGGHPSRWPLRQDDAWRMGEAPESRAARAGSPFLFTRLRAGVPACPTRMPRRPRKLPAPPQQSGAGIARSGVRGKRPGIGTTAVGGWHLAGERSPAPGRGSRPALTPPRAITGPPRWPGRGGRGRPMVTVTSMLVPCVRAKAPGWPRLTRRRAVILQMPCAPRWI